MPGSNLSQTVRQLLAQKKFDQTKVIGAINIVAAFGCDFIGDHPPLIEAIGAAQIIGCHHINQPDM